ncbi:MAG: hypothetical protein ACU83N_10035 [Gammaproteobacteria bacterium]
MQFTNRKGTIRLYDSTATPFYLALKFDAGDLSFPSGRPKPELINILDKGVKDVNSHYILGTEESYLQGLESSFSVLLQDGLAVHGYLLDWIKFLNGDGTAVNSHTLATTKGDTQNDGANNNPAFPDSRNACNLEFLLDGASADLGWRLNEIYIPYPQIAVSADSVSISMAPMIYGTISQITAFTAGTDVIT